MTTATTLEPFTVNVSDDVLTDLERRLRNTRWAPDLNNVMAAWNSQLPELRLLVYPKQ